jgi:hypothetical protein
LEKTCRYYSLFTSIRGRARGIRCTGSKRHNLLQTQDRICLAPLTHIYRAAKNPQLNYTVILNPCSGPCLSSLPEQPYLDEIPKLALYPNIRKLGYVSTNYTNRLIDTVLAEIHQYSLWPSLMNDTRMNVDGIFFDEVSVEERAGADGS